ncbi:hypothetical protein OU798_18175 [Prolixibacteraceae bacterium Z1-6]|uniref:Uncharacterized protein n=1 Tax=Draconibacterium aestuarii TaxID=2998507 RepID=A0A9X3F9E0_9BACT|nr:hypothetical protein [Prolixibacteraceae bacterium Z1-6]
MKNIFTFLALFLFSISVFAQSPEGIIYQAEARDMSGNIIQNETLDVTIKILANNTAGAIVWEGIHNVTTNNFGMFVLVIGTGTNTYGYNFEEINWGEQTHFLNVQVKKSGSSEWIDMGTTQFLSVPYALHAKTAGSLVSESGSFLKSAKTGVPSQTWSLFGNVKTDATTDKLGTTDAEDLVFVTDNIERLRITKEGKLVTADGVGLELGGNLAVHGDSTYIDKDLYVGRNVYLNVNDEFDPEGETVNYGDFTVAEESSTLLTGTLDVDGKTNLNSELNVNGKTDMNADLNVNNEGSTLLSGILTVYGNSQLGSNTNVDGDLSVNTDKFVVDNSTGDTEIAGDLDVAGDGTFANLVVKGKGQASGQHVAIFENTEGGTGDGIKIKLGKNRANNGLSVPGFDLNEQLPEIKELLDCKLGVDAKLGILQDLILESVEIDAKTIAGLAVGVGNLVTGFINTQLGLPLTIVPRITVFPGFNLPMPSIAGVGIPDINIPEQKIGSYSFPAIPQMNLAALGVEAININSLDFWGIPNICLDDAVSNPLNNTNKFIQFSDVSDNSMGSIKAESVTDWATNYLNPLFLLSLRGTLTSTLDKKHAQYHFKGKITEAVKSYTKIGVEYSSGNGDYAEWLERMDPNEAISTGDVVGVIGGKITKDLTNAEQVMAISHRPIVLGNTPEKDKVNLGNNVAFMGQIPVKIMGAVSTGDYIVGSSNIPGYGIAISTDDMTVEDFKYAVGRAWEDNSDNGPKMVNTVIGVHNGDYLNILKRYDQKFRESESRLESIETKIDKLTGLINSKGKIN